MTTFTDPSPVVVGTATKKSYWDKAYDNTFALRDANRKWVDYNTSGAGNSGSGETDLLSRTLPAGVLAVDGDVLRITQWGTNFAAGGADNLTLRTYFGGTALKIDESATSYDLGATASGSPLWHLEIEIIRTGSSAQLYFARLSKIAQATRTQYGGSGTLAISNAGTIVVKATGQSSGGTSNRVKQYGQIIRAENNVA